MPWGLLGPLGACLGPLGDPLGKGLLVLLTWNRHEWGRQKIWWANSGTVRTGILRSWFVLYFLDFFGTCVFNLLGMSWMRAMHAFHACMSCMHVMDACHACMSCMHVMHTCHACVSCMHVMHACHARMSCMHVMHACQACMSCMHALHAFFFGAIRFPIIKNYKRKSATS